MVEKERRLRAKDRRKDSCLCASDPWRYNHLKVVGDIEGLSKEQGTLWAKLDTMVTVKMFGLFMTILTTVLVAFCASMYDTNKQTLSIVTQINEKVIGLEAQRDFYGFRHPDHSGSLYAYKPGLVDGVNGSYPSVVR